MSKDGWTSHTTVHQQPNCFSPMLHLWRSAVFCATTLPQTQYCSRSGSILSMSQIVLTCPVVACPWPATKCPSSHSFTLPYIPSRVGVGIRISKMTKTWGLRSRHLMSEGKEKTRKSDAKAITHVLSQGNQCPRSLWATTTSTNVYCWARH